MGLVLPETSLTVPDVDGDPARQPTLHPPHRLQLPSRFPTSKPPLRLRIFYWTFTKVPTPYFRLEDDPPFSETQLNPNGFGLVLVIGEDNPDANFSHSIRFRLHLKISALEQLSPSSIIS